MPYIVPNNKPVNIMHVEDTNPYFDERKPEFWKKRWRIATPQEIWKHKHRTLRRMVKGT